LHAPPARIIFRWVAFVGAELQILVTIESDDGPEVQPRIPGVNFRRRIRRSSELDPADATRIRWEWHGERAERKFARPGAEAGTAVDDQKQALVRIPDLRA